MSAIFSTWKLLTGLGPDEALLLAEWHLLALLGALGLLAAFGLHWLVGHVFRFYRRGEKRLWVVAALSLPVLVVSVGVWLGSYLLGTGADRLAAGLTRPPGEGVARLSEVLGEALLAPALGELPATSRGAAPQPEAPGEPETAPEAEAAPETPDAEEGDTPDTQAAPQGDAEAGAGPATGDEAPPEPDAGTQPPADDAEETPGPQNAPPATGEGPAPANPGPSAASPAPGDAITLERLGEALEAMPPETLREALSDTSGARPDGAAQETVLAVARQWIGDPDQVWPEWHVAGIPADSRAGTDTPLAPAEFILSLVEEVGPEAALPPEDWAYIAGVRFEQRVLTPLLTDRFRVAAIVIASLMALLDVLLFWGLWRLRRGKRPAKAAEKKKESGTLTPASYLPPSEDKAPGKSGQDKASADKAKAK